MKIATIATKPILGQRTGEIATETGVFEVEVTCAEQDLRDAPDTRKFVLAVISAHLAQANRSTDVSLNMWLVHFAPEIQAQLNFPATLDMEQRNDLPRFPLQ